MEAVSSSDTERQLSSRSRTQRHRPRKSRATVRVIMIDKTARCCSRTATPGVPGASWWVTPGGGIDPGETRDCRRRSARSREETGYELAEADAVGADRRAGMSCTATPTR